MAKKILLPIILLFGLFFIAAYFSKADASFWVSGTFWNDGDADSILSYRIWNGNKWITDPDGNWYSIPVNAFSLNSTGGYEDDQDTGNYTMDYDPYKPYLADPRDVGCRDPSVGIPQWSEGIYISEIHYACWIPSAPTPPPPPPAACEDGFDNDGDGLADYGSDPGCDSFSDDDEFDAPAPTPTPGGGGGGSISVSYVCSGSNPQANTSWSSDPSQLQMWIDYNPGDGNIERIIDVGSTQSVMSIAGLPNSTPINYAIIGPGFTTLRTNQGGSSPNCSGGGGPTPTPGGGGGPTPTPIPTFPPPTGSYFQLINDINGNGLRDSGEVFSSFNSSIATLTVDGSTVSVDASGRTASFSWSAGSSHSGRVTPGSGWTVTRWRNAAPGSGCNFTATNYASPNYTASHVAKNRSDCSNYPLYLGIIQTAVPTPTPTPSPCTPLGAFRASSPEGTTTSSTPSFSWTSPPGDGPITYRIEMTTNDSRPWTWYWYAPTPETSLNSIPYPSAWTAAGVGAPTPPDSGLTTGTTYYWRVRATSSCGLGSVSTTMDWSPSSGGNANGGSGNPGNGDPQVFSYITSPAWLDTTVGNIGSQGPIQELSPAPVGYNARYLVFAKNFISNFTSESGALIANYDLTVPGPKTYEDFCKLLSCTTKPIVANETIPSSGVYFHGVANDYVWGITSTPTVNGPVIIFVDGNLRINQNLDTIGSGAVMFIVKGNIDIHGSAQTVDSFLITNQMLNSCYSGICNQKLTVNGGFVAHNGLNLTRDLGAGVNDVTPAELINYNPYYLAVFAPIIGSPNTTWQEVQP